MLQMCRFLPTQTLVLACLLQVLWHPAGSVLLAQDLQPAEMGPTPGMSQQEIMDGWISLFDGQTLFGWAAVTDVDWNVVDGEIRASEGEQGLLRTSSQFDDYELKLDFKGGAHTNSGVFLRTSPNPVNPKTDCIELNIAHRDDNPFPTGSLVGRKVCEKDFQIDQWNELHTIVDGDRVQVWINDELAMDHRSDKPRGKGYIGLQFNSGDIAFRNIRLRPLNVPLIEIAEDLPGWNDQQMQDSEFSVTDDGELQITGGRGLLETEQQFGDFVFSMKCKTNADGLNSGIFFRCIPGEFTNGYESQIQNQFKNGDRTQPVDCGTGGIFRRIDARRVNANDQQWFAKTIVACGSHISVWVNGYQVTDWADDRKPNPNPRRGMRLEKGTIQLQGHDPTTDILMKNFRARELNPRRK